MQRGYAPPDAGLRIGSPAITSRGFKEPQVCQVAHWIADVLGAIDDDQLSVRVKAEVVALCRQFPVYADSSAVAA